MRPLGKMRARVAIWGLVAAPHMPACPANSQMNPGTSGFEAFLAAFCAWFDCLNIAEMVALGHNRSF